MLPFPSLPWFELARFRRNRLTRAALVAVTVVPLFYGVLYVWANWDPVGNLHNVDAAVVNLDKPVTTTGADGTRRTVPLGRSLAGELTGAGDGNFHWTLTDAADAQAGLADGGYAAVVTIPEDFSAAVTSTAGEDGTRAEQAVLRVRSNDAHNYLAGTLARSVGAAATAALNSQVTETYLDNVYVAFTTLHGQIGQAAEGAADLAGGARRLASGAARTDEGADELVVGLRRLSSGAGQLSRGTGQLSGGASDLAEGAASLSNGLGVLARGTRGLPTQSAQLNRGARKISGGAGKLATGASTLAGGLTGLERGTRELPAQTRLLAEGAARLEEGADRLLTGSAALADGADELAAGAGSLSAGIEEYGARLAAVSAGCPASGAAPAYCDQLALLAAGIDPLVTGADATAAGADEVAEGAGELRAGIVRLHAGAEGLERGTATLAAAGPRLAAAVGTLSGGASSLSGGASTLAGGAGQLARGTSQLAAAAPRLRQGISQAASGAGRLGRGSARLASGAADLDSGASELAEGTSSAAGGATRLAEGTSQVASGAGRLRSGSSELADGLAEGAERIPSYSDRERQVLRKVAATPVVQDMERLNGVEANGAGLAPYFMALALWVGAMSIYMLLRTLSERALVSTSPSWRIVLAGYMPGTVISAAQALLLVGVLRFAVGVDMAGLPGVALFAILVGLTFTAVNQALIATFGGAGRFLALIFVSLQITSAGGTYPIETAPALFQSLHGLLPMTHAVNGLRGLIAGDAPGLGHAAAVLVLWIAGSLLLTVRAARRQRIWTVSRLHATQVV
ncbi:YhgE/Pip domain-containing protein [Planobispora takensis]|uniref:ABC-2 type transporter transmembrane domain-containing protein n=1 Tax=Planobispora takensis TaxID=1367882 RepID=A0A8J3T1I6_9ACTN|nr:YhgE/Pip domain-containing protein [Planobispora takensis]GII04619.1 hypothetical protein Pta02_66270 [Planobispora takensis]